MVSQGPFWAGFRSDRPMKPVRGEPRVAGSRGEDVSLDVRRVCYRVMGSYWTPEISTGPDTASGILKRRPWTGPDGRSPAGSRLRDILSPRYVRAKSEKNRILCREGP